MKLSRLLATLALIVFALAVPAPATADVERERTPGPETLSGVCTVFGGTYSADRLSYSCDIREGTILCAELCEFRTIERLALPPLTEACDLAGGRFTNSLPGQFACQLREGDFTATCPWRPGLMVNLCEFKWVAPSEQPME